MTIHVQVWMGEHLVIDHEATDKKSAGDFFAGMVRRYPSLKVIQKEVADSKELVGSST